MILDILQNNINERPIYFALSTAPSDRLNLDPHLIVEGMAYRVVPFTLNQRMDRYYPAINVPVTRRHLLNLRTEPVQSRAYGFMFRDLNHPDINLDEASTKMIYSFRVLYMGVAQVEYQDANDSRGAKEMLAKMDAVMPRNLHKFDEALRTDLSRMYLFMGDTTAFVRTMKELEPFYLAALDKDITGRSTLRSPYQALLDLYQATKDYDKGVKLMERFQRAYPGDPSLQRQIQSWRAAAKPGAPAPVPAGADTAAK
jgi:hypothetical protein